MEKIPDEVRKQIEDRYPEGPHGWNLDKQGAAEFGYSLASKALSDANNHLKELRKEHKQLYDEYTSVNVRLAEKEKEIDELEFWKEQNDIAHAELKSNYLKVYDELKSKEKEIAELKNRMKLKDAVNVEFKLEIERLKGLIWGLWEFQFYALAPKTSSQTTMDDLYEHAKQQFKTENNL